MVCKTKCKQFLQSLSTLTHKQAWRKCFAVLSVHLSDLQTASLFTHKTQEDHQASSWQWIFFLLQATLQKKFKSVIYVEVPQGDFSCLTRQVSFCIDLVLLSPPPSLPAELLLLFLLMTSPALVSIQTLLQASNSVSCQRLQKDLGFIQTRHIWPPSVNLQLRQYTHLLLCLLTYSICMHSYWWEFIKIHNYSNAVYTETVYNFRGFLTRADTWWENFPNGFVPPPKNKNKITFFAETCLPLKLHVLICFGEIMRRK